MIAGHVVGCCWGLHWAAATFGENQFHAWGGLRTLPFFVRWTAGFGLCCTICAWVMVGVG